MKINVYVTFQEHSRRGMGLGIFPLPRLGSSENVHRKGNHVPFFFFFFSFTPRKISEPYGRLKPKGNLEKSCWTFSFRRCPLHPYFAEGIYPFFHFFCCGGVSLSFRPPCLKMHEEGDGRGKTKLLRE